MRSCSEAMDDSEVDEGDWRGLSKGEAETEGTDESVGWLRFSALRWGTAVDDMVDGLYGYSRSAECSSSFFSSQL